MDSIAVDWDDTLVDARSQEWLPGAQQALRELMSMYRSPFIHTSRANWPEGLKQVQHALADASFYDLEIVAKPQADWYIDNLAVRFESWPQVMAPLRHARMQAEGLKLARKMLR